MVGCALSGHEPTKQAAADRVKAAWAMWLETKKPATAGAGRVKVVAARRAGTQTG